LNELLDGQRQIVASTIERFSGPAHISTLVSLAPSRAAPARPATRVIPDLAGCDRLALETIR
jgi:hypothetical protein